MNNQRKFKNCINHPAAVPAIILLLISLIVYVLIISFSLNLDIQTSPKSDFFIFVATVGLGVIAYTQFSKSNQLTTNEFLLFVSNRWGSAEIIKARQIIHKYFIEYYRDESSETQNKFSQSIFSISEKVLEISKLNGVEGDDFIYLLSLLDFFESISYFYVYQEIELNQINNICGNNLIFYFETFESYIRNRQKHEPSDYNNFNLLYHDLKKVKLKNNE